MLSFTSLPGMLMISATCWQTNYTVANVNNWLLDNSLFLHQGKAECVFFGMDSGLLSANFSVSIIGSNSNCVAEYKYLGVVIDECWSWKAHVKYLLRIAGKRIDMNPSMQTVRLSYYLLLIIVTQHGTATCCKFKEIRKTPDVQLELSWIQIVVLNP